jgi:hypothetical protein
LDEFGEFFVAGTEMVAGGGEVERESGHGGK